MNETRINEIEALALADGWQAGVQGQILRTKSADEMPHLDEPELQFYNRKLAQAHAHGCAQREELRYQDLGRDEQEMDRDF